MLRTQVVLVSFLFKTRRRIHKQHAIVRLGALAKHNDTSRNAHPKEEVGRKLNHCIHSIMLQQILTDFLLSTASVKHTGELYNSCHTAFAQMMIHVHRESQIGFRLRC